jgi:hypothetical protein
MVLVDCFYIARCYFYYRRSIQYPLQDLIAFFMGNALVCGIVTKVGEEIFNRVGNNY